MMAGGHELSAGKIQALLQVDSETTIPGGYVFQVVNVRKLGGPSTTNPNSAAQERYRIILSDGVHYLQGMVSHNFNHLFADQQVSKNGLIRLKTYTPNMIQGRQIVVVLDLDVLTPYEQNIPKIGNPVAIEQVISPAGAGASMNQPAQGQRQPQQQMGMGMPQQPQQNYPQQQNSYMQQPQQNQFNQPPHMSAGMNRPAYGQGNMASNNMPPRPMTEPSTPLFQVKSLSPYMNRWTIRVRVLSKSDRRTWNNAKGTGQLFSMTFADDSGEIRATAFQDQVDKYFELIQEGHVYYVTGGKIKIANKQYSSVNNDYEMTVDQDTMITVCTDTADVPNIRYNHIQLNRLFEIENNGTTDVIAVVKETMPVGEIVTKATQKTLKKRELIIVDSSGWGTRLTLWGKQAESFEHYDNPVIAVKGAKVSEFGGRSLSVSAGASLSINPDHPEAHKLQGWYQAEGQNRDFQFYSSGSGGSGTGMGGGNTPAKTVAQIQSENLGTNEKPDYFSLQAYVAFVKSENPWYPACPSEGCNKKVTEMHDGWRCEKCDRSYESPNYRYILNVSVTDYTGQLYLTVFDDMGVRLLGKSANELNQLQQINRAEYNAIFASALFKEFTFRVRAKAEMYQDEQKIRFTAMEATPIDDVSGSRELTLLIEQLKKM